LNTVAKKRSSFQGVITSGADFSELHGVAIVGARRPAARVFEASFEFAAALGVQNCSVVSGLALGCDTAAHLGCLEVGGHTVAVLPCGLNFIAPASNRPLAKRIQDSGGSLVSGYPPETPPRPFRFVERNRVIVSLSQAVIVMEAEHRSGTMHTARFALEQEKPLACYIPESGSVSSGCRFLLENHGAVPLRNAAELVSFLETLSNIKKPEPLSWRGGGGGGWRV
jgi:DNA processing protein